MDITIVKLITGEEVLGEVESENETLIVLKNPVGVAVVRGQDGGPSVGFAPFPLHAEQKSGIPVKLQKAHIVYSYVPDEPFIQNYDQLFGTGLVLPNKKIITG